MGPIGVSAMVDLYVQKVSLEATQLIASLKMEVMVMHTVNGYPDEGWDNAVTSVQKIVEFIDLFCKKSQQKISMLALVIIDKLQGAHNKYLEAARTKHSEIAKTIALTSAKLLQKAAKFYTYALIAERSGQTVFRALHIQGGKYLAFEATQQHRVFEYADMGDHFKSVRTMISNSVKQASSGNNRSSRMYDIVAHYYKALAAIAIDNFDNNAQHFPSLLFQGAGFSLLFQSAGLQRVYLHFEHQLYTIAEYLKRGMLWQADVLVMDLQNHTSLLDPCICIDHDVQNVFTTINALVESTVHITPDQDALLNQNSSTVTALQITHILHMGKTRLYQYVRLLQEQVYCEELIVESQTNMYANGPRITSFYRRLWKHIYLLAMSHAPAVREAINEYFDASGRQSETEWQGLHIRDWICVTVTLEDIHTCLNFYTQQLRHVRPDRPARVVEVITRAWRSAQSILQQSVIDLEAQVLQKDVFVSVVPREDIQGAHNTACSRALAYAQIAQDQYQNTSGFYTEFLITERNGEKLCSEALVSVMVQLAVFAEEHLLHLDKMLEPTDTAPKHEKEITEALNALHQSALSRQKLEKHTENKSLANLWRTIYRVQIKCIASNFQEFFSLIFGHIAVLEQLLKRMTQSLAHIDTKTVEYLLLASQYFVQSQYTNLEKWVAISHISGSYTLAAQAQFFLSEMSLTDFRSEEDASITLARMCVDRLHCNALCYIEMMNNPRKDPSDSKHGRDECFMEHCRDGCLIGRSQEMLSNDYRDYEGDNSTVISVMVWENTFIKEFFSHRLPQSVHVCQLLCNYGYSVLEQHRDQMDELVGNFQEEFTCRYTFLHAKNDKSIQSKSWWKRAETAARLVRTCIYSYCFDGLPVETIRQSKILHAAIKQCAVALDDDKSLHASCTEVADLALTNLKPSNRNVDCAERTQRDIMSKYCASFLVAAATEDTAQIELTLVAVANQKQVLQDLRAQQRERMFTEY